MNDILDYNVDKSAPVILLLHKGVWSLSRITVDCSTFDASIFHLSILFLLSLCPIQKKRLTLTCIVME